MSSLLSADLSRYPNSALGHSEARPSSTQVLRAVATEQGAWAVVEYRFRRWARTRSGMVGLVLRPVCLVTRKLAEILTGISISTDATIGPGLYIGHFGGIIIGRNTVIGEDCNLGHGVTLGGLDRGRPTIGDRVYIAPGAKIIGGIAIGDDAKIGANAVVTTDVPVGATAVGVPARVVERVTA